jgi:hypothetical protein
MATTTKDPPSRRPRARAGGEPWPPCPRWEQPPADGQLAELWREGYGLGRAAAPACGGTWELVGTESSSARPPLIVMAKG